MSLRNREKNTNEDIWAICDELHSLAVRGREWKERAKELGISYDPDGLLWSHELRTTHLPIECYIRDWMHIVVSGGIANNQVFGVVRELKGEGVPLQQLTDYALEYTLPSKYGSVSPNWLAPARFDSDSREFHSFASYLLTLIPIIAAFLEDMVLPHGIMQEHIQCFLHLQTIVLLLSSGAEYALKHINLLAETIVEHHKLFVRLYPGCIKTKFHQILHLPELYLHLKKVISCFDATMCF